MKRRQLSVFAACFTLVAGVTLLSGVADDAGASKAALEQQLKETLKVRSESALSAYQAIEGAFIAETVTFDMLADATRRLADAEVAMATNPGEVIAALIQNVGRTKQWEARIKALFDAGLRGGEAKEYFSAKRDRESAEIMLLNARIQAKL